MLELERIKKVFNKIGMASSELHTLPRRFAVAVKNELRNATSEEKKSAIALIRKWVDYTTEHSIEDIKDPFLIRFHINRFAKAEFGKEVIVDEFKSVDLEEIPLVGGKSFEDLISDVVDTQILKDKEVSIFGGTARLALKMLAQVDVSSELPVNDIDIITNSTNPKSISEKYGIDLAGTKVIDGDLYKNAREVSANVDCTMNQVFIFNNKLFYTAKALEDVKNGIIRLRAKDDPLFGIEGYPLPDGNVYLNRNGFYRTLAFLLRRKGEKIIVSKENLERERQKIGRYWAVLLFVKILKMKNKELRDEAIANWFLLAKQIDSTKTNSPVDFLNELLLEFTDMVNYAKSEEFDINRQVRWLIGKLTSRGLEYVSKNDDSFVPPDEYTPENLVLPKRGNEKIDLRDFYERLTKIGLQF